MRRDCIEARAARLVLPVIWLALAFPGIATAAESATVSSTADKMAGVFAGLVIGALLAYALFIVARPLIRARDRDLEWVIAFLLALWAVKSAAVIFCPGFRVDVGTYEAWALAIAQHGPASMYQTGFFLDYPPAYLYALWAAGAVAQFLGASSDAALRVIVETPALAADFLLAALMFVFVRRTGKRHLAWLAMLFVALNPAMIFDTVGWGQTDSGLTLVLLLAVAMMLDGEFELAWAFAALGLLVKPQAITLFPVLGLWTLLRVDFHRWWRAAFAFAAVIFVVVAPFQVGHPWNWLPGLYLSTAAYYHETSVNAFNFMALVGGLRQNDAGTFLGISYYALGLMLLLPLYAFVARTLWRNPTRRNLLFTSFIALFGFFMFAPRMHERYLYPALAFVIPLALAEPAMLAVFVLLTMTCLFNLAYVLHTLNTVTFLDSRAALAMAASFVNLCAFAIAACYGYARAGDAEGAELAGADTETWLRTRLAGFRAGFRIGPAPAQTFVRLPWTALDTGLIILLTGVAAALRFWHIGHPPEIVFDEVHFVGQARHYLHGEPFLDPHPPIAKLVIAAGIYLFGDQSSSWRVGNATLGTILVGITYLLGSRMFRSRLAATLAAAFIACDGFFIVDSRIGCIDIVYLTFAAISYLLLFRFIETPNLASRKRTLIPLGVVLGLCLGSKLYVPAITLLLVGGFVLFTLWRPQTRITGLAYGGIAAASNPLRLRWVAGAILMLGSLSGIFYLVSFLPHYELGWWGGIADLFHYYKDVVWYEKSVSTATHPYASPWWSWPLMLRPVAYWQNFPEKGDVATIWGAGNPLTWWGVIPAMTITAVRALERPSIARTFMVIGFLAYFVIWIPIGRILFLYHYMPSIYIGYLALGAVLADLWNAEPESWESVALLLTIFPVMIVGLGHIASIYKPTFVPEKMLPAAGMPFVLALAIPYILLLKRLRIANRFVFVSFLTVAVALFIFYLPIWLGIPITREGYYARMWLQGPGLRDWI